MRLIDADELKDQIIDEIGIIPTADMKDTAPSAISFVNRLNMALTIDAVPVVRCEYCYAYRKDKELARAAYLDEDQYCALLQCEMPPNGYCYYGNKKENIRKEYAK